MSLGHGSSVIRDGLVFYYDAANTIKSWNGAPATNLFTETNLINWSKSATVTLSPYVTPYGNPSYAVSDTNTSGYLSITRDITVANDSSSYTLGLLIRKTTGGTSARLGFNSGFSGGTTVAYNQRFNSDTGVGSAGTTIDLGKWWYWYFTITNNGTGNTTLYCSFYPATGLYNSSDNSAATGTAIIGEMMLVAGSTAARFVNGTRSSTQALIDITGTNTVNAVSLTYASNNTFSFNGTADYLSVPLTNLGSQRNTFTIEMWAKLSGSTANLIFNAKGQGLYPRITNNGSNIVTVQYRPNGVTTSISSNTITLNTWYHFVFTYDSSAGGKLYTNGTLTNSETTTLGTHDGGTTGSMLIGRDTNLTTWGKGNIDVVKMYDRVLTADEIQQNFEALRGRYGI